MSNHIHLLVQAKGNNLSDVLRDFKKFTSQRITKAIEDNAGESRKRWLMWLLTSEKATDDKAASYRFGSRIMALRFVFRFRLCGRN